MPGLFNISDFEFFKSLIREAGTVALDIQRNRLEVSRKEDLTIVTQADIMVQDLIISRIRQRYSNFNFIYEENFDRTKSSLSSDSVSVIIDPIDGTAMFSMHLPFWCVSIGIFRGYEPVYGFVYSPGADMLFCNDDVSSYLNNKIVGVEKNPVIDTETNIFYASEVHKKYNINFPGKVRNLGSTALHACLTVDNSRNRLLAFIGQAFLWDWAGAIPIILKAGGNLKYITGKEINYREIVENGYMLPDYLLAYNCDDFEQMKEIFQEA